jgi:nucleoside-diphosphate-sugar epimerase
MYEKKPVRNKNTISRKIEDETLVLDLLTKQYHILNETAGKIWELSDGNHTIQEIAEEICREYDKSVDIVKEDVLHTVEGLSKVGVITME